MKKTETAKIAIYSRKSKFTGTGESVENQIELCRQYIRVHFRDNGEEGLIIYEDEGYSGGDTDRPKFKQLMNDARGGKISAVACYRLDRVSRNIGDFARLIEELNSMGIGFISVKEQFDTSSPIGRAMMYIASVFSQLERETIAERIRDNMLELAKTGRWLGGATPTGYASEAVEQVTVDGKKRKAFKLTVIPEEARLIRLIYNKFFEGNSLTKVETYLLQNHIGTKRGNPFTRFSIKSILENPVYMISDNNTYEFFANAGVEIFGGKEAFDGQRGIMAYNKTLQKKGKANKIRDMSEWIIAVGKHEGIISGADWIKAQSLLEQNKPKAYRKPKNNSALLSGILLCGCGAYMRPKLGRRQNADGEFVFSYLCELKEKSRGKNCGAGNPNGNILDKLVCEEVKKLPIDQQAFITEFMKEKTSVGEDSGENDEELDRLQNTASEAEKEIGSLVSSLAIAPETAREYIVKKIDELHAKKTFAESRIAELGILGDFGVLSAEGISEAAGTIKSPGRLFDTMDAGRKRAFLRSIIRKIIWDGEDVRLYFYGAED